MESFKLSKWYFDCVNGVGDVIIVYTGVAQWRKIRLHYSSVLESASNAIVERRSLRSHAAPKTSASTIIWHSKPLNVDGRWEKTASSVSARLWASASALSIIAGVYAIGNGAARFAEEAYRGEPQTPMVLGLRLYQWLAIGTVVLGAAVTSLPSGPAPHWSYSSPGLWFGLLFAFVAGAALGVDFPESESMLARLT